MEKKYIFWTGGWDSTYRVVEMSRIPVEICPLYVDDGRKSKDVELSAMAKIRTMLEGRKETKAVFCDIQLIKLASLAEDEEIKNSCESIRKYVRLGSQYDYLARVAKKYPGVEVGLEKPNGEFSAAISAIMKFGALKIEQNDRVLDRDKSTQDIINIFGNQTFPIAHLTELDMVENVKKWGYENVMREINFCYHPIHGRPCGMCRPCEQKMECGMQFLLPRIARVRYRVEKMDKKIYLRGVLGRC